MTYVVIDADGTAHTRDTAPTLAALTTEVGPEGWARVRLSADLALAGFVNDCGLLFPEKYPRNVAGSVLLYVLGAGKQPYAGPVVITGWQPDPCDIELRPLTPEQLQFVTGMHADILRGLDGHEPEHPAIAGMPSWADGIRILGDHVRTAPTPHITFTTVQ
jgi:hypothetical protein